MFCNDQVSIFLRLINKLSDQSSIEIYYSVIYSSRHIFFIRKIQDSEDSEINTKLKKHSKIVHRSLN